MCGDETSVCMRWCSNEHEVYYDVKLIADDSIMCGIMHESVNDVDPDNLPRLWTLQCNPSCEIILPSPGCFDVSNKTHIVNCVTLSCGHQFHISVLAIHFALNDMRCPICREGNNGKLCLQELEIAPAELHLLETYVNASRQRSRTEEETENEIALNMHRENMLQSVMNAWTLFSRPMHLRTFTLSGLNNILQSSLLLLANITVSDATTSSYLHNSSTPYQSITRNHIPSVTWQSRLLQDPDQNTSTSITSNIETPAGHTSYRVHRSFRRFLFSSMDRMSGSDNVFLHFTVDHPLLPHALFSRPIQISTRNTEETRINIETSHVDFALGAILIHSQNNTISVTLHTSAIEMLNASLHPTQFTSNNFMDFILIPMSDS